MLSVPVIAVFTKFDALVDKSYNQLRKEGIGRRGAKDRAPGHATEFFEKNQLIMINETPYPPKSWVCLSSDFLSQIVISTFMLIYCCRHASGRYQLWRAYNKNCKSFG